MNKINILVKLLVAMKNAYAKNDKYANLPVSFFLLTVLVALYKEGIINGFQIQKNFVRISLKYVDSKPLIYNLENISKPSLKKRLNEKNIKIYLSKYDRFFMSTSTGITSSKDKYNLSMGGILLFGFKLTN
jgi:ribosomal protein S8